MKKMKDLKPELILWEAKSSTASDFVRIIEEVKREAKAKLKEADLLFRGQREDKDLLPKLARLDLRPKKTMREVEDMIIKEFKRTYIPYVDREWTDEWDILALAQHHGLPTRLLDWTFNALQALWFAVRKPPAKDDEGNDKPGIVWVFLPTTEDYRKQEEDKSPFEVKLSKIFRPRIVGRRLSSQSGVFTVHAMIDNSTMVRFNEHQRYKDKLKRIVIQPGSFPTIRKELDMLGINHSTAFPDLDGLCKHLEWRYSFYDDEIEQSDDKLQHIVKL